MICRIEELIREVRVALDRNNISDSLLGEGDLDTLTLDEIIRSKIPEAVRRTHCEAPVYMLEEGHDFGDTVYWDEMESGHILLPDDFMRLIVFRMSDWERPVYAAITPADREYALQSSRYKGIRGTAQKPVCAIVNRPEGKALEFYSCKSEDAYVAEGMYLPYPEVDAEGGIDICERCRTAIVYMAAALTCTALGEPVKCNLMKGGWNSELGISAPPAYPDPTPTLPSGEGD